MKRNSRMIQTLAATLCLTFTLAAHAAPPGGGSTARPVKSQVLDTDTAGAFQIRSDSGDGGSQFYVNGTDGVVSTFQDTNEWELSALSSANRLMRVDLPYGTTSPWPGLVPGRFSWCSCW